MSAYLSLCWCHIFLFLIPCCAGGPCSEYGAGERRTGSVSQLNKAVLIKKSLSESLLGFLPLSFPHSISSITASALIFPGAISILFSSFALLYFVILFFPQPLPSCVLSKAKGQQKVKVREKTKVFNITLSLNRISQGLRIWQSQLHFLRSFERVSHGKIGEATHCSSFTGSQRAPSRGYFTKTFSI